MKLVSTLVMFLAFGSSISAKDFSMIPFRKGAKWGYCDANKKVVIKPKYERTWWFADNGFARVKDGGKYGFINKSGERIFESQFDTATDFSFDAAIVKIGNKKYCLFEDGSKTLTDKNLAFHCASVESAEGEGFRVNYCDPYMENGLYGIRCSKYEYKSGRYSLIGSDTITARYDTIYCSLGYNPEFTPLIAEKDDRYGIVNSKNDLIYPFEFDSIRILGYNTFLLLKNGLWSLKDTSGSLYSDFTDWDSHLYYSGTYITVQKGNIWGVVNDKGDVVIPPQFEDIKLGTRHIIMREFTVKKNGKWGYVCDKGNVSPIYDALEPFNGYEYTEVVKNGLEGYINRAGVEFFE